MRILLRAFFVILGLSLTQTLLGVNMENKFVLRGASSLEKIFWDSFKNEWLYKGNGCKVNISACKNDCESFQIVIIPKENLQNVRWKVKGSVPSSWVKVQPVGYVEILKSTKRWVKYPKDKIREGWWPDPLFSTYTNLPEVNTGKVHPIWITIDVPIDAKAGMRNFQIVFEAKDSKPAVANINLKIWDFALGERTKLKTSYWYEDRYLKKYYLQFDKLDYSKQENKDKFWKLIKPYLKLQLDNRMSPVFVQWPNNIVDFEYDTKSKKWIFDFTEMERRLRFILDESPRKGNLINLLEHHYGHGFKMPVKVDGKITNYHFKPQTKEMENFVIQYLQAWKKFLKKNDWYKYAYVSFIDEPKENSWENVKWLYPIVKKVTPELPAVSTVALDVQSFYRGIRNEIDIMVPNINYILEQHLNFFQKLQAEGAEVWGYVCGATSCIDYQAIDHRIWNWISWRYNLKGSLYWAMECWLYQKPPKAMSNPKMFTLDPAKRWPQKAKWCPGIFKAGEGGDGYLIYPSPEGLPWSSIRLETVRDGIEDYEYFCKLKENLDILSQKGADNKLIKKAKKLLNLDKIIVSPDNYSRNITVYQKRREAVGDLIEKTELILKGR